MVRPVSCVPLGLAAARRSCCAAGGGAPALVVDDRSPAPRCSTAGLKNALRPGRGRRRSSTTIRRPSSFSFPSGHALFATCFFGGIAVLLSHRLRELGSAEVLVWLAALVLILLIGVSRIYLGVHYPTDVIGGFAVGDRWVTSVALGDRLAERRRLRV